MGKNMFAWRGESTETVAPYRRALEAFPPIERTREGDRLHVRRSFRGLTREQAIGYLESLGGTRTGSRGVRGDGWRATLSAETVPVGPSSRLTGVTVDWTGEAAAVDRVVLRFRLKAPRTRLIRTRTARPPRRRW